jgi:hypothetical protein
MRSETHPLELEIRKTLTAFADWCILGSSQFTVAGMNGMGSRRDSFKKSGRKCWNDVDSVYGRVSKNCTQVKIQN